MTMKETNDSNIFTIGDPIAPSMLDGAVAATYDRLDSRREWCPFQLEVSQFRS